MWRPALIMSVIPPPPITEDIPNLTTDELYRALQGVTVPSSSPRARFNNWGQSYYCKPLAVFEPETEGQCKLILELARREGKVVRAVGVGHSPSDLACTTGFMVRMTRFKRMLEVCIVFYHRSYPVDQEANRLASKGNTSSRRLG